MDAEGDVNKWLRVGAAGRAEHYSDFGGTIDGKLTARVQPDRYFLVRGSISTGFRAPSLGQSFFSSTAIASMKTPPVSEISLFARNGMRGICLFRTLRSSRRRKGKWTSRWR